MFRCLIVLLGLLAPIVPAHADVKPFPAGFRTTDIRTETATLHVRVGGKGPAVLLLHGFGDTGDMWAPLAAILVRDHTVIVPDLRGMGLSSHQDGGYDKKSQARELMKVLEGLDVGSMDLVTHDIGNMVGYALAAQYPERIKTWVIMDAPLPGIGHWEDTAHSPKTWHFYFRGPDVERLVAGRERILLDRFYNELSDNPRGIDEATRAHYAVLYARPGAMHDAFNQFAAFAQDAIDNREFSARAKLPMPVLAIGGEKSYGGALADELRFVASNVSGTVISGSGHWLMEEQTDATVAAIVGFVSTPGVAQRRVTPGEITQLPRQGAVSGTSGVTGIETTVLTGDPTKAGLYTIRLSIPANTVIRSHTHRDERASTVVSGTFYFGYGADSNPDNLKPLSAGSFYTEPAGVAHYAMTKNEPCVLYISGMGPTDTVYAAR